MSIKDLPWSPNIEFEEALKAFKLLKKSKTRILKDAIKSLALSLISTLRNKVTSQSKFIFEPQHATKNLFFEPLYTGNDYLILLRPPHDLRVKKFNDKILTANTSSIEFKTYLPSAHFFKIISAMLQLFLGKISKEDLGIFLEVEKICWSYGNILKQSGAKVFVCANNDEYFSYTLTHFLKKTIGIKIINISHGNIYQKKECYDIFVLNCFQQEKFLRPHVKESSISVLGDPRIIVKSASDFLKPSSDFLFYDQPSSHFVPAYVRQNVLFYLNNQSELNVYLKPHPASPVNIDEFKHLKLYPKEIIPYISFSLCSTATIEDIAKGIPSLFLNYNNLLQNFIHLKFMSVLAPKTLNDFDKLVSKMISDKTYTKRFLRIQQNLLKREYPQSYEEELRKLLV